MNHDLNNKHQHEDLVFSIRIQYRCNSSWQGTVQWLDGRKTQVFRSALELGNLISDARQKSYGDKFPKDYLVKWEDKDEVS